MFFCGTALRTSSPNCSDAGVRSLWPYLLYPSALGHHPYSDAMQALQGGQVVWVCEGQVSFWGRRI